MATTQSATAQDIADELISGMPEGYSDLMDLADPDGPGPLFAALGTIIAQCGTDQVDDLRDQLSPMSCSADTLGEWEAALDLAASRLARAGTNDQRRAQVVARLREWGAPTLDLIRRVVYTYLGYSSPADVVILESDRAALRTLHTSRWTGARTIGPTSIDFAVADGGTVGPGGAAVDLCLTTPDLSALTVALTSPDTTIVSRVGVGRDAAADGRAWAAVASGTAANLNGVWAAAASDAWAVGAGGTILRWNGTAWSSVASGVASDLLAVHGTSSNDVWAVGVAGVILHWNGTSWSSVTSGVIFALVGVWAVSPTAAWAVGGAGTILKWDGTTWSAQASGTGQTLRGVWASDVLNVWAVGDVGTIVRTSNGSTWGAQTSGVSSSLNAVRGTGVADVWAVGDSGVVLRYNALGLWMPVSSGVGATLRAVAPDGTLQPGVAWPSSVGVWAAGASGTLIIHDPSLSFGDSASGVAVLLTGLWARTPSDVWAVGASGTVLRLLDAGTGRVRVYFPEVEGLGIYGLWTVSVNAASGTLSQVDLFVEGAGLDSGGASGRGTAAAWWGVMFEESKSAGGYDLDAARRAVSRLTMSCRWSNILRRSSGAGALAAGRFGAIPGDPGALPGAAVPGT